MFDGKNSIKHGHGILNFVTMTSERVAENSNWMSDALESCSVSGNKDIQTSVLIVITVINSYL